MRYYILILLTFLLTSCGSMYQLSTLNHTPEYIGDVRVDVIESRMDLNWKLRTDNQFRWDFAQYAQNQPLSWYYDNSWELGLYRTPFTAFDLYWNRTTYWWNWSFNYPYNWGWNRWNRWSYYGWSYWNDPFRFGNGWAWGYNPHRWNYRPNYNQFIVKPQRPRVVVNGRRGSNNNNTNIIINRGRSNDNNNVRIRRYENKDKIVPRRNYNDIKIEDRTPIRNNDRIRITPPNRNSNPVRVNPPTRTNPNIRSSSPPVVRPNISRGSSSSSRSSVGRRGNN
jgi:hypothetical protein